MIKKADDIVRSSSIIQQINALNKGKNEIKQLTKELDLQISALPMHKVMNHYVHITQSSFGHRICFLQPEKYEKEIIRINKRINKFFLVDKRINIMQQFQNYQMDLYQHIQSRTIEYDKISKNNDKIKELYSSYDETEEKDKQDQQLSQQQLFLVDKSLQEFINYKQSVSFQIQSNVIDDHENLKKPFLREVQKLSEKFKGYFPGVFNIFIPEYENQDNQNQQYKKGKANQKKVMVELNTEGINEAEFKGLIAKPNEQDEKYRQATEEQKQQLNMIHKKEKQKEDQQTQLKRKLPAIGYPEMNVYIQSQSDDQMLNYLKSLANSQIDYQQLNNQEIEQDYVQYFPVIKTQLNNQQTQNREEYCLQQLFKLTDQDNGLINSKQANSLLIDDLLKQKNELNNIILNTQQYNQQQYQQTKLSYQVIEKKTPLFRSKYLKLAAQFDLKTGKRVKNNLTRFYEGKNQIFTFVLPGSGNVIYQFVLLTNQIGKPMERKISVEDIHSCSDGLKTIKQALKFSQIKGSNLHISQNIYSYENQVLDAEQSCQFSSDNSEYSSFYTPENTNYELKGSDNNYQPYISKQSNVLERLIFLARQLVSRKFIQFGIENMKACGIAYTSALNDRFLTNIDTSYLTAFPSLQIDLIDQINNQKEKKNKDEKIFFTIVDQNANYKFYSNDMILKDDLLVKKIQKNIQQTTKQINQMIQRQYIELYEIKIDLYQLQEIIFKMKQTNHYIHT